MQSMDDAGNSWFVAEVIKSSFALHMVEKVRGRTHVRRTPEGRPLEGARRQAL